MLRQSFYLSYLLPILWIAASTVVALALYRTSRALVEHTSPSGSGSKRVRLVGSIAIAVVVFILLWRATPPLGADPDALVLPPSAQHQLSVRRTAMSQAWARYQACLDLPGIERCPEERSDLNAALRQFNAEYNQSLDRE
jgi:hypothetical protein